MNLPFVNSFKGFTKYFLASNLKWFYFTIFLGFISMGILTFRTFTFKFLVDALIEGSREMFVEAIWITVFVYVLGNFLRAAEDYMFVTLINKPSYRMRVFAFEYLLKQPFSYYQDKLSGKILGDYYSLRKCFTIFGRLYKQYMKILEIVIVAGIAFWVSAYIGILFLAFGCVVYGIFKYFNPKIKKNNVENQKIKSKSFGFLFDFIANIKVVKNFNLEKKEMNRFKKVFAEYENSTIERWKLYQGFDLFVNLFLIFMEVVVFLFLLKFLKDGIVTVGEISVLYLYLATFKSRVLSFAKNYPEVCGEVASISAGINRVFEPLKEQDVLNCVSNLNNFNIEFKNLNLHKDKQVLLRDINLKIPFGTKLGLVGKSGAGKSTLVSTLLRVFYPDSNQVFLGGVDIINLKHSTLLSAISIVDQDTQLLNDTILMNLTLGKKFKQSEIRSALKKAYLWNFVDDLPEGLKTLVGERGVKLSGGQRQRIGIARAILFDTPIVILDEATASLDVESERYIQKSIENLIKNKTVLCIAHRLSTLNIMDEILVMDKGQIIEHGTHKDLIDQAGKYADLWKYQNNNFI